MIEAEEPWLSTIRMDMDKRSKVKICDFLTFYLRTKLTFSIVFPGFEARKFQTPANFYRCYRFQIIFPTSSRGADSVKLPRSKNFGGKASAS